MGHISTIILQKVDRDRTPQGQQIIGIKLPVNKMLNEYKNNIFSHNLAKYPVHVNDVVGEAKQRVIFYVNTYWINLFYPDKGT